jgi:periplasmic copper chaperone A
MSCKLLRTALSLILAIGLPVGALAHGYKLRTLEIVHPWTQPPASGSNTLVVCMIVRNKGKTPDRLISASSSLARSVALQTGTAPSQADAKGLGGFVIPVGGALEMQKDGQRLVLEGVSKAISPYDMIPMTLVFERAGKIKIEVMVED